MAEKKVRSEVCAIITTRRCDGLENFSSEKRVGRIIALLVFCDISLRHPELLREHSRQQAKARGDKARLAQVNQEWRRIVDELRLEGRLLSIDAIVQLARSVEDGSRSNQEVWESVVGFVEASLDDEEGNLKRA